MDTRYKRNNTMNEEVKNKWITELRSGKYSQAIKTLKDGDCYCPLGILCLIYFKEHGGDFKEIPPTSYIPQHISKWAKLNILKQDDIMKMNDEQNLSFEQIADFIQKNY